MTQQLQPRALLHLLLECVIGILGVFGSVLCLCTVEVFSLPAPDALFFVVPVLMLGFCLLFRQRKGWLWGAVAGLAIAALILLLRRTIFPSAEALWNTLMNHYSNTYDFARSIHPELVPADPADAKAAILTLAVVETWVVALSLARWRRAFPAILALALGVLPCYIALNTMPAVIPLMMVVCSALLQILTQSVRRREPRETWKAVLWALVLSLILLGGLLCFNPRESYTQPVTWRELARKLEKLGNDLNNRGNFDAGLSGNPEEVEFERLRSLPNHPITCLRAAADYSGVCYLRGSSYSEFDGASWSRTDGESWPEEILFPYLGTDLEPHYIRVETMEEETPIYTAYEMLRLPDGGSVQGDDWYRNDAHYTKLRGYSLYFALNTDGAVPYTDPEYEAWVRERCTALPERTRQAVMRWWLAQGGSAGGERSVSELAELVAERVSQCARYDRSPDPQPDGTDFCEWFLNDAGKGYCVHYATAAAAVLRALGVPTRYVSGYIFRTVASKTVDVCNTNAHAWVEYFDGGVWHRLEPTPGEALEFAGLTPDGTDQTETVTVPPDSEDPGDTETIGRPPETETMDLPPLPTKPTRPRGTEEKTPGGSSAQRGTRSFREWLRYLSGAGAFVLLVLLRRKLANRLRERKILRAPANERARLLYHRYRRLCRITGSKPDPRAEALAKKAVFSQHRMRDEELDFLHQCVDQAVAYAESSGLPKRIWYRYVLAII